MAKKNKNNLREKYNDDIINELFGSSDGEPDIEADITDLGQEPTDDTKVAENPKKKKFFFGFALFVVVMAIIGLVSCGWYISRGVKNVLDDSSLKNEFARFILPAVANDISPFQNETEISDSAKINCSIWSILLDEDYADYKSENAGEYIIPEYDVGVACKALFGSGSAINHQTVGYGEAKFTYDEENHVYTCSRSLRYLSYAPRITEMTNTGGGTYVCRVEYIPPSISAVGDDLGVDAAPDKVMEYTINRYDRKNTLMAVKFIEIV